MRVWQGVEANDAVVLHKDPLAGFMGTAMWRVAVELLLMTWRSAARSLPHRVSFKLVTKLKAATPGWPIILKRGLEASGYKMGMDYGEKVRSQLRFWFS